MKDTKELREFLITNMKLVASGEQSVVQARAICGYAQQVYNTLHIEVKSTIVGPVVTVEL